MTPDCTKIRIRNDFRGQNSSSSRLQSQNSQKHANDRIDDCQTHYNKLIIYWQNGLTNKLHPIFNNDAFEKCEDNEKDVKMNYKELDISNPFWKLDVKHIGKCAQIQSANV